MMEASIIDLRYKMKDVLEALERRVAVKILYHGKVKGTIVPVSGSQKARMTDHPFFGMRRDEKESVPEFLDSLRRGRLDAF
jgi:antitoxin (DNA-binding transcriptional repressor) of toxin-antitoxin stability system